MATDNPGWATSASAAPCSTSGATSVGTPSSADAGLAPSPERNRKTTWTTFLKAHRGAFAATDFFTIEVLTRTGLVRYFVLFGA